MTSFGTYFKACLLRARQSRFQNPAVAVYQGIGVTSVAAGTACGFHRGIVQNSEPTYANSRLEPRSKMWNVMASTVAGAVEGVTAGITSPLSWPLLTYYTFKNPVEPNAKPSRCPVYHSEDN